MKTSNIFKTLALTASTLLSTMTAQAMGEEENALCHKKDAFTHSRCWYVGGGLGLSHIKPKLSSTSDWQTINKGSDASFKGFAGVSFDEHWFTELSFENLGAAGLNYTNSTYTESGSTADYAAIALNGGYWLKGRTSTWDIFAKAGFVYLQNNDDVSYVDDNSVTLGFGAEWRFAPKWLARVEFTRYDEDARTFGLSVARYLGKSKTRKSTPSPASPPPSESAPQNAFDFSNIDIDNDGVINTKDICPNSPEGSTVDSKGCPVVESINLKIQFDTNVSDIKDDFITEIEEAAEVIKSFSNVHVTVAGHTDSQGKEEGNQTLSESRAQAVAGMLMKKTGLESHNFTVIGHGELKPIADNATAEGRYTNRRVMVLISQQ